MWVLLILIAFILIAVAYAWDEVKKNPNKKQRSFPGSVGIFAVGAFLGSRFSTGSGGGGRRRGGGDGGGT